MKDYEIIFWLFVGVAGFVFLVNEAKKQSEEAEKEIQKYNQFFK